MRVPAEVVLRQDEMRRAAAARREMGETDEPETKTLCDDCAERLLAWWARSGNKPVNVVLKQRLVSHEEIVAIAQQMRNIGIGASMIQHEFKPDPWGRDTCDRKTADDGITRTCGLPRREHVEQTSLVEKSKPPPAERK